MKRNRGTLLIIIGIILVILQLMSIAGNVKAGVFPSLRFDSLGLFFGDLVFLFAYLFVGILGVALIIIGDRIHNKYKAARSNKIHNAYYNQQEPNTPNPPFEDYVDEKNNTQNSPPHLSEDIIPLLRRILSGSLSIIAVIAIIIAMNFQEIIRNEMERISPTLIYLVFLVLFGIYPVILLYGKEKVSEKPQSAYPIFLAIATFAALYEGSAFSNGYFSSEQYVVYAYMDFLSVLNVIWSSIPFAILIINQDGFIESILRAWRSFRRIVLTKIFWKTIIITVAAVIACQSIYLIGRSSTKETSGSTVKNSTAKQSYTTPPAANSLIEHDRPKNGYVFEHPAGDMVAPLTVKTSGTDDYYVALKHTTTSSKNMSFYVRGGSTVTIDVPLGVYEIYYASGSAWYGKDDLFGTDTAYYKCEDVFPFTASGDGYDGWTLTLYPVANGNLETDAIDPEEFPN